MIGKELIENFDNIYNDKEEDEEETNDENCSNETQTSENEEIDRTSNAAYNEDSNEDENMTEYSHDTEHELNEEGNSGNDKDSGGDDINNNPELETEGKDSTKKVTQKNCRKLYKNTKIQVVRFNMMRFWRTMKMTLIQFKAFCGDLFAI